MAPAPRRRAVDRRHRLRAAYATSLAVPLWFQAHQQRILIVTSGSMAPKFDAGDAVVLRAISDESDLKVGQVISFWPTGSDELVTHRIVALRKLPDLRQDEATGTWCRSSVPTGNL